MGMRIALTGASGFIGSAIARALHGRGHSVTALVRQTSRRDHIEGSVDRFVVGEQDDPRAWGALLEDADAVVHDSVDWRSIRDGDRTRHLRSNLLGSIEFLRAATTDRARPFVYMSSIAVHHDMSERWGGEPDEEHPLRPSGDYGALKASVEAHLWGEHFSAAARGVALRTVALRPCAVYGVDPTLERSHGYGFVKDIVAGKAIERTGGGKFVHVDDVAVATVAALESRDGGLVDGQAFNLVDCYARWCDLADMAGRVLGLPVEIDRSAPAKARNMFMKDRSLALVASVDGLGSAEDEPGGGRFLERGHPGLERSMERLVEAMRDSGAI
ncbi:MAG: NAD-dependent epimerase/dehydratase family protein [Phycisphaerales bacterium]